MRSNPLLLPILIDLVVDNDPGEPGEPGDPVESGEPVVIDEEGPV